MFVAASEVPLGHGEVLGLLLGVEGFLFAAISLSVTLAAPNQPARRYEWLKPDRLLIGAASALTLIGLGALIAWGGLYLGGHWNGWASFGEGAALMLAVVAQPAFAFLLAMSARR